MYSLKHLAAQKLRRDTCVCQPVLFVCDNIQREMKKELRKLQKEFKKQKATVDELFHDYDNALTPENEDFLDEYADQFGKISTDICAQYDELETSEVAMDNDEWYAYMEFIASRVAQTYHTMPQKHNYRYMIAMGFKAMVGAMKAPESEPSAVMTPVARSIRVLIDLNNKFIKEYDAKHSFEVVEKKQKKYGKALDEWQAKIRPDITRKIDFYKNVLAVVGRICSCKKT